MTSDGIARATLVSGVITAVASSVTTTLGSDGTTAVGSDGTMALGSDGTEPAAIVLVDVRLVDLGVDGLRASARGWDPGSEPRSALGQKGWARGPADHAPRERSEGKGACTWRRSAHRWGGGGRKAERAAGAAPGAAEAGARGRDAG